MGEAVGGAVVGTGVGAPTIVGAGVCAFEG